MTSDYTAAANYAAVRAIVQRKVPLPSPRNCGGEALHLQRVANIDD